MHYSRNDDELYRRIVDIVLPVIEQNFNFSP